MNVILILCGTLRRDHCWPYTNGKRLNECWSREAPAWLVSTPNMEQVDKRNLLSIA